METETAELIARAVGRSRGSSPAPVARERMGRGLAGFAWRVRLADYPGGTGRGVRVAVIDSGIHPSIRTSARWPPERESTLTADWHDTADRMGHGTAVAAAIRDKAPDVEIVPVRVFHRELRATADALEAAIAWAVSAGVHVINLSLGTANPAHEARLAAALGLATAAGVCLVAAGPQEGTRWLPGSLPGAVAVYLIGPAHATRRGSRWADVGPGLAVAASGYPRPIPGIPLERNLKGVSFAVANVSGLLALHLSR